MFLKVRNIVLLWVVIFLMPSFIEKPRQVEPASNSTALPLRTLEFIRKEGRLRVVVDYNSTNYFVYRGNPMGFTYEMLKALAADLQVSLELFVTNNIEETFKGLETGRFDLAAKNLTVTPERADRVDFTVPIGQTRQVLVQRYPAVQDIFDLAGKTVYIQKDAVCTGWFGKSETEVQLLPDSLLSAEQLISQVALGTIDYTICDENVARVNQVYYPNLDVDVALGSPQDLAWAVCNENHSLKKYLDDWLVAFQKSGEFQVLYHKYYLSGGAKDRIKSQFHSLTGGRISPYDDLVRSVCAEKGWDWRLISSLIFVESGFDPKASSGKGAGGLMQLLPETAEAFGASNLEDPNQNIRAGIQLLNWLNGQLKSEIPDSTERVKFVLAAYNVGLGHVADARKLAEKYGRNPAVWSGNVEYFLEKKSTPKFYADPVVRWGYCRGEETTRFVSGVLYHYRHYRNIIPEQVPERAGRQIRTRS